jgi:integrase
MVYRRKGGTGYTFQARTRHGWHPLTTPTTSKALASRMEGMWEALAREHRAWDLLEPILAAPRNARRQALGRLYDLWVETRMSVPEVRRRLQDVDLVPLVESYLKIHAQQAGAGWNDHVSVYLDYLLPEGTIRRASEVTVEWLTERLYAYPAGRNTLRRVHSGWSGFLGYCTDVRGLFARNPMELVTAPAEKKSPIRFFELDAVERIIGHQDSEAMRAIFTLLYGTGIEISTALRLTRADVALGTREIRAAGTKAHQRHRIAIVAEWAWPALERYVRPMLPTAPLFPADFEATSLSRIHRRTVTALKLTPACTMHAARHHWAVMRLRAGTPVAVVQNQLGHSTPMLTLTTYGPFIPTGADRAYWEEQTTKHEARRKGNSEVVVQAVQQRKDATHDV